MWTSALQARHSTIGRTAQVSVWIVSITSDGDHPSRLYCNNGVSHMSALLGKDETMKSKGNMVDEHSSMMGDTFNDGWLSLQWWATLSSMVGDSLFNDGWHSLQWMGDTLFNDEWHSLQTVMRFCFQTLPEAKWFQHRSYRRDQLRSTALFTKIAFKNRAGIGPRAVFICRPQSNNSAWVNPQSTEGKKITFFSFFI